MRHLLFISALAALLCAACGPSHDDMRRRLDQLAADNRADSLLTNDSLARTLADYFDRHGTANERMMAHYLLGRTYADRGDAPLAVQSYQNAIEAADTTRSDCDYRQLAIVYGQMSSVFYQQNLYSEQLLYINKACYYANIANDTVAALLIYAQKDAAYEMLQKYDSVLFICETVYEELCKAKHAQLAASFLLLPVRYLADQSDTSKARRFLTIYERESGFFDKDRNIEAGREIYYYSKGYYYLKTCHYDSAEYYFRKELATGLDFNNQNAGSRGLALLYQQTHRPDSAAKYALYSYAMNDSLYDQKATAEVAKKKALYDYQRYQQKATKEKKRADHERARWLSVAVLALIVIVVAACSLIIQRIRHKKAFLKVVSILEQTQDSILQLRSHEAAIARNLEQKNLSLAELESLKEEKTHLTTVIQGKEEEISKLKRTLEEYHENEKLSRETIEQKINDSDAYRRLRIVANQGKQLNDDEWHQLIQIVITLLPGFYNLLTAKEHALTQLEYRICILDRLNIEPRRMHYLLRISEGYVSQLRRGLHFKLFGEEGNQKDFSRRIKSIC